MSSEGTFVCAACEADQPKSRVEYDELGYPICPVCGAANR